MIFQYMDNHSRLYSIQKMASVLEVSRSGFYAWKKRKISSLEKENIFIVNLLREIQEEHKYRYGSPRLVVEIGNRYRSIGKNRIARLMRLNSLNARGRKRFKITTKSDHKHPVPKNLLAREFNPARKDQVWVSDITYLWTGEGWLYLCVIIDLYSRKVIGWSMNTTISAALVVSAFKMAVAYRNPAPGVLFHSDRGVQYCSKVFRKELKHYRMIQSMSRRGNCWDNAPAESFFKTLKWELIQGIMFENRNTARKAVFEYIEVYYNRRRIHSTLGYVTPTDYESNVA